MMNCIIKVLFTYISQPVIINIFTNAIIQSHKLPTIPSKLLTRMKFHTETYLTSIGLMEAEIVRLKNIIENGIRLAIIPLKAYSKEFVAHLPLLNTNVELYIKLD